MKKKIILTLISCITLTFISGSFKTRAANDQCGLYDIVANQQEHCVCNSEMLKEEIGQTYDNLFKENLNEEVNFASKYYQSRQDIKENHICYNDGYTKIRIEKIRQYNTDIYMTYVKIDSSQKFSQVYSNEPTLNDDGKFPIHRGKNPKIVPELVHDINPILAINGPAFNTTKSNDINGILPMGPIGADGRVDHFVALRTYFMYLKNDGELKIEEGLYKGEGKDELTEKVMEDKYKELLEEKPRFIVGFGPTFFYENEKSKGKIHKLLNTTIKANRTAIGQKRGENCKNEFLIIVTDGRTKENEGLTFMEMALLFKERGYTKGYNLDGGGSSTLVYKGNILNKPYDAVQNKIIARKVNSALCIVGLDNYTKGKVYLSGDMILYNNEKYMAKYWTKLSPTEDKYSWLKIDIPENGRIEEYSDNKSYSIGEYVKFNGKIYISTMWTKDRPDRNTAWKIVG